MNKFLKLSDSQRKDVYESIAHKVKLPAQVVEKDFWVSAIRKAIGLDLRYHTTKTSSYISRISMPTMNWQMRQLTRNTC